MPKATTAKRKTATKKKAAPKAPKVKKVERVFPSSVDDGVIAETLAKEAQQNA
jgi:hypothetical protein